MTNAVTVSTFLFRMKIVCAIVWFWDTFSLKSVWNSMTQIPDLSVQYSNGNHAIFSFDYWEWSSIQTTPWTSEYRTSKSSLFWCFHYSDVGYSDPHSTLLTSIVLADWFARKNLRQQWYLFFFVCDFYNCAHFWLLGS